MDELKSIGVKIEESVRLGTENGAELRSLRKELGMEGLHGRLPTIEAAIARIDRAQEDDNKLLVARVNSLEELAHQEDGRGRMKERFITILTSSGTVALLGWLAKTMGFLH
ncbi:MAG: hypothetical protein WA510_28065 [Acidobacteriaceae bacterium]